MIDGRNLFYWPVKNDLRRYDNIQQISTGQGDDYTNSCLLDYNYFKEYFKMIVIDLSKQEELASDTKAIQQINSTRKSSATSNNIFRY